MKLWEKGISLDKKIEKFTVGKDRDLDLLLATYDIEGSMAHSKMLASTGVLSEDELSSVLAELEQLHTTAAAGNFRIEDGVEDVHSQVEKMLVERLGDVGKKIHTARSRNDQVLVDIKLFAKDHLSRIFCRVYELIQTFAAQSEKYKEKLLPGYTHLQIAMPSSFGLWFGAYAESLTDDLLLLQSAYQINDRNPLGSAAGYGSSFPIDRKQTTDFLQFSSMAYNVVYAQMGRGKVEFIVASAFAALAQTIAKFAMDACLYNSQNFGFIQLPDHCTTGSSIMPHKKNPDVFELLRGKCNHIESATTQISLITKNLPSGYFRDYQILKEVYLPLFTSVIDCLEILLYALPRIEVKDALLDDDRYAYLFSVEAVNDLVQNGTPFRDAYKIVGEQIAQNTFSPDKNIQHTHHGSIGNLCTDKILERAEKILHSLPEVSCKNDNE